MTRRQWIARAGFAITAALGSAVLAAQAKTATVTLVIDGMT